MRVFPLFCAALLCAPSLRAQPQFSDQTAAAGITYRNVFGGKEKQYILESHGSGAAFFDHDSDGDLDLYIVNGATFATYRDRSGPGNALYRNRGDGTFAEITRKAGVGDAGWGGGVAVGDIDNDGRPDLYATNYGANVLYRNRGGDPLCRCDPKAGVGGDQYSASAAFFDYDRDGGPRPLRGQLRRLRRRAPTARATALHLFQRPPRLLRPQRLSRRTGRTLPQRGRRRVYRRHPSVRRGSRQPLLRLGRGPSRLRFRWR